MKTAIYLAICLTAAAYIAPVMAGYLLAGIVGL